MKREGGSELGKDDAAEVHYIVIQYTLICITFHCSSSSCCKDVLSALLNERYQQILATVALQSFLPSDIFIKQLLTIFVCVAECSGCSHMSFSVLHSFLLSSIATHQVTFSVPTPLFIGHGRNSRFLVLFMRNLTTLAVFHSFAYVLFSTHGIRSNLLKTTFRTRTTDSATDRYHYSFTGWVPEVPRVNHFLKYSNCHNGVMVHLQDI